MSDSSKKVALITGVSSGIGQATARLLNEHHFTVYGTSRFPKGVQAPAGVELLELDVRSDASVTRCVSDVLQREGRIDVLINNAGYLVAGAAEEFTVAEAQAQFDTNLWGTVRMTQAVLPGMRANRAGHIVNVTSIGGLLGKPFWAFYCSSKFALEGYSESLRYELRSLGINVSVVEPGSFRTDFWRSQERVARHIPDYDWSRERVSRMEQSFETAAADPIKVARRILDIIQNPSPGLRYGVGRDAAMLSTMRRFLPESLFQWVALQMFHLNATNNTSVSGLTSSAARQGA